MNKKTKKNIVGQGWKRYSELPLDTKNKLFLMLEPYIFLDGDGRDVVFDADAMMAMYDYSNFPHLPAAPEPEIDLIGNDPLAWALNELTSLESKFGREIARVANLFGAIRTKRGRAGGVCICDRADQHKPERAEGRYGEFNIGEWVICQFGNSGNKFWPQLAGAILRIADVVRHSEKPDQISFHFDQTQFFYANDFERVIIPNVPIGPFTGPVAPSPSSTPTALGTEGEELPCICSQVGTHPGCSPGCTFPKCGPQPTTSGEEKVYRWVKAGERLPDYGDDPLGYFRLNGRKVNGNFYDMPFGKAFRVQHHNGDYDVYEKDFDRLEWLEESPAPSFDESNLRACLAAEKKLVAYWKGKAEGLEAGPYIDKYGITYSSEIVYKALQMEKDLAASLITGELPEKKDAEPPADILEWINGESRRYCPHMGMLTQINFFKFGAVAMWRKMQAERPGSSNPEASYWFEKARTNLEDRNDFKAQLSRANERIASLTKELEDGKYNNIWDAWEAFEKANEEMHPMNAIVDPESNSLLPKNQWVVKRASAERGAKWMRQALDQELKDQKAKQREQSKEIASLSAERDEMRDVLQSFGDGRIWGSPGIYQDLANKTLSKYPQTKTYE